MGCCLSREDDRFHSGREALLPKRRSGNNKRVENSVDVDLAKKEGTNGSYKSPSAVVAAGDATSKAPAKPHLPPKAVESVDLLELDDKTSTPVAAAPMAKALSVFKPTSSVEPAPALSGPTAASVVKEAKMLHKLEPSSSKPTQTSTPKATESSLPKQAKSSSSKKTKTSPKALSNKPMETENDELVVSAFTSVSVKADDVDNDNNGNDNIGDEDYGDENNKINENMVDDDDNDNDGKDKPKDLNPKKKISSKKSKKKRKKGKK